MVTTVKLEKSNVQAHTDNESIGAQHADLLFDILSTQKALFTEGISEYDLIELLKKAPYRFFDEDALRDPLVLFKTHFVLFHVLYKLRHYWRRVDEGELSIHALNIKLVAKQSIVEKKRDGTVYRAQLEEVDTLADYYLDWSNFENADRNSVDNLLDEFWQRMAGEKITVVQPGEIDEAHQLLGLCEEGTMTLALLKRAYKKNLQLVHPDKGGEQEKAQNVIHAYHVLLQYYSFK